MSKQSENKKQLVVYLKRLIRENERNLWDYQSELEVFEEITR